MGTIFDDPFVSICVDARLRSMNKHDECPQLVPDRARCMYGESARLYESNADFRAIIRRILNEHEPFESDAERYGYAVAIGFAFYRIRQQRDHVLEAFERLNPQPPIEAYEQDM